MKSKEITYKLWNSSFIYLIIVSLFSSLGFSMVYVIISNYAVRLNASLSIAGLITGIFSISALVIRPIAGRTVDIFNKRNVSIFANLLIGLCVFGYSFSDQISMLFLLRVLHGMAFGISSTATIALVTEFIPKERMGEGIGCFGIGQVIAQVIGPNLSVYIADKLGYQSLFVLIAGLSFLSGLMLLFLPHPKAVKIKGSSRPKLTIHSLIAKEVVVYAIVGGMFSFGNGVISSFLVLLGKEREIANVGIFFSVGAIVIFVLRLFIGHIVDKQRFTFVISISLFITALSMVIIGTAPTLNWLIIASVLKSIGQGTGQISLQTKCIKGVEPARVGVATSTFYIGADIGQAMGPILGGKLSEEFNYMVMYLTCAVFMIITIVLFRIFQKKKEVVFVN